MIFQQDDAPPHFSKSVHGSMTNFMEGGLIELSWALHSPGLSLRAFFSMEIH